MLTIRDVIRQLESFDSQNYPVCIETSAGVYATITTVTKVDGITTAAEPDASTHIVISSQ